MNPKLEPELARQNAGLSGGELEGAFFHQLTNRADEVLGLTWNLVVPSNLLKAT